MWVVVGVLLIVAAMRIVAWDDLEVFAVCNTMTALVYLPAWVIAPLAALGRRPFLAACAGAVVAAQVAFVLPELTASAPLPGWTSSARTFRAFDANVYQGNRSMAGYATQIVADRPQLVTLEEANPRDVVQLVRSGALDGLPYRFEVPRYDSTALLIASAYPLAQTSVVDLDRHPLVVRTRLLVPGHPLDLWVAHTVAPLPSSFAEWHRQLDTLIRLARARGTANLLVMGDLNATWGNRGFRGLLATGLVDGAAARGDPFQMTWTQMEPPLPPLVRIDHVLTGPGVAVTSIRTGDGPGSDHRDVWATVAVR